MRLTDAFGALRPEDLDPTGLPQLREAVSADLDRPVGRIGIMCGGIMALTAALKAIRIRSNRAHLLMPRPFFPAYESVGKLEGFICGHYDLHGPLWQPDPAEVAAWIRSERPAAVIVNSPHNPTGSVLPSTFLDEIIRAAESTRSTILFDEAFRGLVYDNDPEPDPPEHELIVRVGSFNKRFPAMSDARVGYLVAEDKFLQDASLIHRAIAIGASIADQYFAVKVMRDDPTKALDYIRSELREHRDIAVSTMSEDRRIRCDSPEGGLFAWVRLPDDWQPFEFRDAVKEKHGFWMGAGPRFGCRGESRVRFRFGIPLAILRRQLKQLRTTFEAWKPSTVQ